MSPGCGKMDAVRVVLRAYTASFRVPGFYGYQLTLPVPPLATVYGIIAAAVGRWVSPYDVEWLAYACDYQSKGKDLEAIYQFERKDEKSVPVLKPYPKSRTVIEREFLFMPSLTLYLPPEWEAAFLRPRYPLLLGRSQDVATVESLKLVKLEFPDEGQVKGVILPIELVSDRGNRVKAWLQNLPLALTGEPYRRLLGMRIFGIVDAQGGSSLIRTRNWLIRDSNDGRVVPIYRREWVAWYSIH